MPKLLRSAPREGAFDERRGAFRCRFHGLAAARVRSGRARCGRDRSAVAGGGAAGPLDSLEERAAAATLELYSLESQLARARNELAAIAARRAALARERASARTQLTVAKQALLASQSELSNLARALYQHSGSDPLAVLLGAKSLEEAIAGLDGISRAAGQNNRIVEQARDGTGAARRALCTAGRAGRRARRSRRRRRGSRASSLAATSAERRGLIAELRRQQGLNATRIAAIQAQARTAASRTTNAAVASPPPRARSGRGGVADRHCLRGADAHRHRHRLHDPRQDVDRHSHRAGRRRRRPVRDPARNAPDDPGVRRRHRRRHGRRGPGEHHRRLVPDERAGAPVGPSYGHRHHPLVDSRLPKPRGQR